MYFSGASITHNLRRGAIYIDNETNELWMMKNNASMKSELYRASKPDGESSKFELMSPKVMDYLKSKDLSIYNQAFMGLRNIFHSSEFRIKDKVSNLNLTIEFLDDEKVVGEVVISKNSDGELKMQSLGSMDFDILGRLREYRSRFHHLSSWVKSKLIRGSVYGARDVLGYKGMIYIYADQSKIKDLDSITNDQIIISSKHGNVHEVMDDNIDLDAFINTTDLELINKSFQALSIQNSVLFDRSMDLRINSSGFTYKSLSAIKEDNSSQFRFFVNKSINLTELDLKDLTELTKYISNNYSCIEREHRFIMECVGLGGFYE